MNAPLLDPKVSVFTTTDEELAYNAWLSEELEQRASDKRPPLSHAQVGANLDKLLDQLKMKAS